MYATNAALLKIEALRISGTLNPRPERVADPLFRGHAFFDAHDLVQVKYEMLRRVDCEDASVQTAAASFGFSRMTWYQVKARYDRDGLVGLLPQRRGPKAHPQKHSYTPVRTRRTSSGNNTNYSASML